MCNNLTGPLQSGVSGSLTTNTSSAGQDQCKWQMDRCFGAILHFNELQRKLRRIVKSTEDKRNHWIDWIFQYDVVGVS